MDCSFPAVSFAYTMGMMYPKIKSVAYMKSGSCHDSFSERMQQNDVDMT